MLSVDPWTRWAEVLPVWLRPCRASATPPSLDKIIARQARARGVPGVIFRYEDDAGCFTHAAGQTRRNGGVALRPDTPFHIASLGKLFTATAVMRLAERGALHLDAPVTAHLPPNTLRGLLVIDGQDRSGEITLRHLLGHHGGLPNLDDAPGFIAAVLRDPNRIWLPKDLLDQARSLPPVGAPGRQCVYSSSHYHLLGLVLEQICGKAYPEIIREEVFTPFGLSQSYHTLSEWPQAARHLPAPMHHYAGPVDLSRYHPSFEFADGGFVSTARDMTRFARGLAQGVGFRHPQTWQEMIAINPDLGDGVHQGLGPMVVRENGQATFALHGGYWGLALRFATDGSWAGIIALGQARADPWALWETLFPALTACIQDREQNHAA
ncbi:MAG: beta-lactamase family protein [Mangrovicoccus sp.]|nr:beta-lactamase family protein [Mangrovicoccus sp.]